MNCKGFWTATGKNPALESQARFGLKGRTLPGSIESIWVFSRRVLRAAKRNEDGVRVLKIEREKKFSRAELLSLDRAGLMGVRWRLVHISFGVLTYPAFGFCLDVNNALLEINALKRAHNYSPPAVCPWTHIT